jgi:hypothetical protein
MIKAIQITAMVKEDDKIVEYETGKHDSISAADNDLLWMVENTKDTGEFETVEIKNIVFNIVDDFIREEDK